MKARFAASLIIVGALLLGREVRGADCKPLLDPQFFYRTQDVGSVAVEKLDPRFVLDSEIKSLRLMGKVPSVGESEELGVLIWTFEDGAIHLDYTWVTAPFQGQGIHAYMVRRALDQHPGVSEVVAKNLTASNIEAIDRFVAEAAPAGRSTASFLRELQANRPREFVALIHRAIEETPTYRALRKNGFAKFCRAGKIRLKTPTLDSDGNLEGSRFGIVVDSFAVCRSGA